MKLLVSTRKGLLIYSRSNGHWKYEALHFKGIPVSLSYHDPVHDTLWAFLDHGHWGVKVQRSRDFGETWEELTTPKYPEAAEVKEGVPAALNYVWAAEHGGSDRPDRMWLGTVPGGLFVSDDAGQSFQLNTPLWDEPTRMKQWFGGGMDHPGIHSVVVDPRDSDHVYIGISCAGVYETTDGGASWTVRNTGLRAEFLPDPHAEVGHDPHLLVACQNAPDHMWQQNHCGIFKTSDGARTWHEVGQPGGPAHFGFTVAVDEHDPEVAWVVPAISDEIRVAVNEALCVCRTTDGGKSWEEQRQGLPQEGCFDIVYRHGMVKSDDALVFGTTTGNLFHSNDGGDHWETISNFLPMVYAVRIVQV